MLLPHRPLLFALAGWLALAGLAVIWPGWLIGWQAAGLALGGMALVDAGLALRPGHRLTLRRELRRTWPVGVAHTVTLILSGAGRETSGWLYDRPPAAFTGLDSPLPFRVRPGGWTRLDYRLRPTERGDHRFEPAELRRVSPLRLWLVRQFAGEAQTARVYPNFARIAEYALLATDNRLSQPGVLRQRRRGEGADFQELREYRRDDPLRRIDWKATAKRRKPIARDYQDERDQHIVFLLDCGQRMRARDAALSHFDHTLDALLLLAYVALRQGDAVGLATFAHAEPRFLAPRKSKDTVQRLLNASFDLQPSLQPSDYLAAGQSLAERLGRRSLVVLLTNLRDEDATTLPPALEHLGRRHLVLLANLRETTLDTLLREPVGDFDAALRYAAAVDYRRARRRQLAGLRARGASVLDVAPSGLAAGLVNRYWDLKRGGKW